MGAGATAFIGEASSMTEQGMASPMTVKATREAYDASIDVINEELAQTKRVMGYEMEEFQQQGGRTLGAIDAMTAAAGIEATGSAALAREESVSNLVTDQANLRAQYQSQMNILEEQKDLAQDQKKQSTWSTALGLLF